MQVTEGRSRDFGYVVVNDFFTKDETDEIWQEIFHLDYILSMPASQEQRQSEAAYDEKGKSEMTGDGKFLHQIYHDLMFSAIFRHTRKLFEGDIADSFNRSNPANDFSRIRTEILLLNRYKEGDQYKPHIDGSTYSAITTLQHRPNDLEGGDLLLVDYGIKQEQHNSCIIFPSWVKHQVTPLRKILDCVKCPSDARRYSITQFMQVV